jgi:hypothetical protein
MLKTHFRILMRLIGLVVLVVLAGLAHASFVAQQFYGFVFLALAGIVLTVIAPEQIDPPQWPTYQLNLATGNRFRVALGLLFISTLILLEVARIFVVQLPLTLTENGEPLSRFGLGLLIWIVAIFLLTKNEHRSHVTRISILLCVILGIAVVLRLILLELFPTGIWLDEAANGLIAQDILHNPVYRPIYTENIAFPHAGLFALALGLFGDTNITAMRLVAVCFALGGVIMGYVVGRQLRGHTFGLIMAVILATMHWSINFSRIAMNGMEVVFFTLLAFSFLIRLVGYGQIRDAVLAGLSIGTGFWFYRSFQIMIVAFALFILFSWKYRPWRKTALLGLTLIVNVLVVIFPIVFMALTRTEYFDRVNTTSIFGPKADMPVGEALPKSLLLHLGMFHIKGDPNGRHNLPGEPMLDPITGILFGLGLIYALRSWQKREHLFFYAALLLGLSGGILTLTFEAPQSLRSIGVLPSVAYFSALGALALGRTASASTRILLAQAPKIEQFAPLGGVLGLTVALTVLNYDVYFGRQRFDYTVWKSYSTYETLVGRTLAEQDKDTLLLMSPFIFQHKSTQFLAKSYSEQQVLMKMPDVLPIRLPPDREVMMFFVPIERMLFEYAMRLYPNATFHVVTARDFGIEPPPQEAELFYTVKLRPEDIAAVQGLDANGKGSFYAPDYQVYQFVLPENARLTLDGRSFSEQEISVRLPRGQHAISITPADAQLSWKVENDVAPVPAWLLYHEPVTVQGVRAAYYANADWQGAPVTIETHPFIYQRIQILPRPRPYSVIYTGQLYVPQSGEYAFRLSAIDYARLSIDGDVIMETIQANKRISKTITLTQGWHTLEVRHQDLTNNSFVFLEWQLPGSRQIVPIPIDNLRPADPNVGE